MLIRALLPLLTLAPWFPFLAFAAEPLPAAGGGDVDFQRDVRPILSDNCFQCHGPDEGARQGGLRLDIKAGAFSQRDQGFPVVPGDLEASLLYQRITQKNERLRMPPAYSKKQLTQAQVEILKGWIEEGAAWDLHWSFQPLGRPELPTVRNEQWVRSPVDRFVLTRFEAEGLEPAPEADRRALARRVALDLTGLPPKPDEVEAFVNDPSESAYERLVDQLLASPHWGEHRARYWLDAARYGDTHGLHIDNFREMWPYRDWVIQAFNQNKPFDQFTVEQIAGDLLPDSSLEQRVATGFHRCNVTTNEGGAIIEEYAAVYAKDRADTTGTVWLGLTVGCATCHDHKFDPISQQDFYSMTAFFRNSTQYVMDGNVADPAPIAVVPQPTDRARWEQLKGKAADIQGRRARVSSSAEDRFETWLAGGEYRSLKAPLGESSEILTLVLDREARLDRYDGRNAIELSKGMTLGAGPEEGGPALHFADESWAELPSLELGGREPFSITVSLFHPSGAGDFMVASQSDPDDHNRGWKIEIDARVAAFQMFGDKVEAGRYSDGVVVRAGHLQQLEVGTWNHLAISYDGSGERAGLSLFLNGEIIPTQGSEYFTSLQGSIRTDRPLLLGKQVTKGKDEDHYEESYFKGGAIADFRIFNRAINVEEARLVSLWPVLKRAQERTPVDLSPQEGKALRLYYLNLKDADYRRLSIQQREVELEQREIRRRGGVTHVMQELADRMPSAHILYRGQYDDPRDLVQANTPVALPPMPPSVPRNRLGLARWLVDDSNPLTARVTVNRFWQQVFGTGLVRTSDDFGSQGEPPSHPGLLDWLAMEFRDSGWDVKDVFRLLVTSSTYRQSAEATTDKIEKDRENRLLSRGPRFRMDGEMVRDYALAASGILASTIGGPSVKPYQPAGVWEAVAMPSSNTHDYEQDHGDSLYRRSLYTFWKRSAPPASMELFNAPTRENCTVRRERTNTPLQALVTMNDPQFVEASRFLAQKAILARGDDFDRLLDYMTERVLVRRFRQNERRVARHSYNDFRGYYELNPEDARQLVAVGESQPEEALPVVESAALTMLANQLLNLDEVLNK